MAGKKRQRAASREEDLAPPQTTESLLNGTTRASGNHDEGASSSSSSPAGAAVPEAAVAGGGNEARFGRRLASSDKAVRDATLSTLRLWLAARASGGLLNDLDLQKVWRGLWFCMFMCDKLPVQVELGRTMGRLVHLFSRDHDDALRFIRAFFLTTRRDWGMLDGHRLDKFYGLVRYFLRESLRLCCGGGNLHPAPTCTADEEAGSKRWHKKRRRAKADQPVNAALGKSAAASAAPAGDAAAVALQLPLPLPEWNAELLSRVMAEVEAAALTWKPDGLRLHLADIFVEELSGVAAEAGAPLTTAAAFAALAPWLRVVSTCRDNVFAERALSRVLERIVPSLPVPAGTAAMAAEAVVADMEGTGSAGGEDSDGGGSAAAEAASSRSSTETTAFAAVDTVTLQAAVFEAAATPATRQRWRTRLYALHKSLERRTGVRGTGGRIIEKFLEVGDGDAEGDGDENRRKAGDKGKRRAAEEASSGTACGGKTAKRRKLSHPNDEASKTGPAVGGWVAAAIASGEIEDGAAAAADDAPVAYGHGALKSGGNGGSAKDRKRATKEKSAAKSTPKPSDDAAAVGTAAAALSDASIGASAAASESLAGKPSTSRKRAAAAAAAATTAAVDGSASPATAAVPAAAAPLTPASVPPKSKREARRASAASIGARDVTPAYDAVAKKGKASEAPQTPAAAAAPKRASGASSAVVAELAAPEADGGGGAPTGRKSTASKESNKVAPAATAATPKLAKAAKCVAGATPAKAAAASAATAKASPAPAAQIGEPAAPVEKVAATPSRKAKRPAPAAKDGAATMTTPTPKKAARVASPAAAAVPPVVTPPPAAAATPASGGVAEAAVRQLVGTPVGQRAGAAREAKSTGELKAKKKKVTFGGEQVKDYHDSIKDLRKRLKKPAPGAAEAAGTPTRGVLRVRQTAAPSPAIAAAGGGGSRVHQTAPRPRRRKAVDFF